MRNFDCYSNGSPLCNALLLSSCFQEFLPLVFSKLHIKWLEMDYFGFFLLGICSTSWTCWLAKFGKFSVISSIPHSYLNFSPWTSKITNINFCCCCYCPIGPWGSVYFFFSIFILSVVRLDNFHCSNFKCTDSFLCYSYLTKNQFFT